METRDIECNGHAEGITKREQETSPTCNEDGGYYEVVYCSRCEAELSREYVTLEKTGDHIRGTTDVTEFVGSTCHTNGYYVEKTYCYNCGELMDTFCVDLPLREHKDGETKIEDRVEPTFTEDGHYDKVLYCGLCGDEMNREQIVIPKKEYPNSIELDEESLYLSANDVFTPTLTILPDIADKSVTYHSSDESVVTVENGVIRTVAPGNATVTVTTLNGLSDTVTVTVSYVLCGSEDYLDYAYVVSYTGDEENVIIPETYHGKPVTEIREGAFENCVRLKSVVLPETLEIIGERAFNGCAAIASVSIPPSVTEIQSEAFMNCTALQSIDFLNDSGLEILDFGVFKFCSALESITLPETVNSIGYAAFWGCTSLESISVAEGNEKYYAVDNCIIDKDSATLVVGCKTSIIPNDERVVAIGESAFAGSLIEQVNIGSNITRIGFCAFYGCTELSEIVLPDSVTYIETSAFEQCKGLVRAQISKNVTYCGASAFADCDSLKYAECPNYVVSELCATSLETLVINGGADGIGYSLSGAPKLKTLKIATQDITYIYPEAFIDCAALESIDLSDSIKEIKSKAFMGCVSLVSIDWPASLEVIGESAFEKCESLGDLNIPDSVKRIGSFAFYICRGITEVVIGDGVTYIGQSAFVCENLERVTMGESVEYVGRGAFGSTKIKEFEFSASVKTIESNIFSVNIDLNKIVIHKGVETIAQAAFSNCPYVTELIFMGTKAEWLDIEKGHLDAGLFAGSIGQVVCLDGTLLREEWEIPSVDN